jgi:pimeloyl-ACP methyl ester carboxylesterase
VAFVHAQRLRPALIGIAGLALVIGCSAPVESGHGTVAGTTPSPRPPATSSSSAPTAVPAESPANWADCSDRINISAIGLPAGREAKLSFDCATISVPLDYARPSGDTIDLALVRVRDSDNKTPARSLIVNPGGPGGSGLDLALGLAGQLSDTVLTHFDIVGFDPRGVGASSPIECLSDAEKDRLNSASPDVRTDSGLRQAKRLAKSVADKCAAKYGRNLAEYNTVQTAKDMNQIRQAVGDTQLNYLGFSYGTELGAQYAHLFPGTVRVAVLDGAVDPLTDDITSFANQLEGFEEAFDQFAAWCRRHSPCNRLGNPRQAVTRIAAAAKASPIPSSASGETRKATSSVVYTGVLSALYSQSEWKALGQALLDADQGDAKGIFALADNYNQRYHGHYTNISDANTTINCNDSKPGPTDGTVRATAKSWVTRFPLFGLWSAPSLFTCQQWQPHRTVPPRPTAATTPHKILVVGNLHDPATPYQGAKDLANTLGNAELLTWDGEGHTSYLQGSTCVDNYVNAYLVKGTLPPPGTTCPR